MVSGQARPGDLFAAAARPRGPRRPYAGAALAAGAVAVLTDDAGAALLPERGRPVLRVADVRAAVGPVAACVYGDPSGALRGARA